VPVPAAGAEPGSPSAPVVTGAEIAVGDEVVARLLEVPGAAPATLADAGLTEPRHLAALVEHASRLAHSDPAAAGRLLDVTESAAADSGAADVVASILYARARLVLEEGRPDRALSYIDEAESRYSALGLTLPAMRTRLGRMHVLDDLGRHREAADLGRALVAQVPPDAEQTELIELRASAQTNLGVALGYLGRHGAALESYAAAEETWRRIDRPYEATVARANQGVELLALGRVVAASDLLTRASVEFEAVGDQFWFAKCLGHRGEAMAAMGRLVPALDDLEAARTILATLEAGTEAWRLAIESAQALMALGMFDEAVTVLSDVEPRLGGAGLAHDHAICWWLMGVSHLKLGDPASAERCLSVAVPGLRAVGDSSNGARAQIDLSWCRPPEQALALLAEAGRSLTDDPIPDIDCALHLRRATLLRSDPAAARAELRAALALSEAVQLPAVHQAVLADWGLMLHAEGDLDGAVDAFMEALEISTDIGARLGDIARRAAYAANQQRLFGLTLAALLDRSAEGDVARAAALSERAKTSSLVELTRGTPLAPRAGTDEHTAEWLVELDAAYSELMTSDRPARRDLNSRILGLERRISARRALEPGAGPEPERPGGGSPDEPRSAPPSVSYHLVGDEVVAFVAVAGRTRLIRHLTDRRTVLRLVGDLEAHTGRHAIESLGRLANRRIAACVDVLKRLYAATLAPVIDLLGSGGPGPRALVVSPHGPLHRIPFHALHDGRQHLVAGWAISYSPSPLVAGRCAATPVAHGPSLVVSFDDPDAPRIADEAAAVAQIAPQPTVLLRGAEATTRAVRRYLDGPGLVHIASHGLFRAGNAAFSALRLADGWLRAVDVATCDLPGATVVLSACETGRTGDAEGQRAIGLAQGFLAAGARTVVVSQWLVNDTSTEELMIELHQNLAQGRDPVLALRESQLTVMRRRPHPYYWAPFVAVGAPAGAGAAS
jgi:tetratricopeptide (TPR) repeat protein